MVLHEQWGATVSARAPDSDRGGGEFDFRLFFSVGACPAESGVVKQAKRHERCARQFAARSAVAQRNRNGERAAGVGDKAAGAAAAKDRRRRRSDRVAGGVHESQCAGMVFGLWGLRQTVYRCFVTGNLGLGGFGVRGGSGRYLTWFLQD